MLYNVGHKDEIVLHGIFKEKKFLCLKVIKDCSFSSVGEVPYVRYYSLFITIKYVKLQL